MADIFTIVWVVVAFILGFSLGYGTRDNEQK